MTCLSFGLYGFFLFFILTTWCVERIVATAWPLPTSGNCAYWCGTPTASIASNGNNGVCSSTTDLQSTHFAYNPYTSSLYIASSSLNMIRTLSITSGIVQTVTTLPTVVSSPQRLQFVPQSRLLYILNQGTSTQVLSTDVATMTSLTAEYGGGLIGFTTTSCVATLCQLSSSMVGFRVMNRRMYFFDSSGNAVGRAGLVSGCVSPLTTTVTSPRFGAVYKGYLYVVSSGMSCVVNVDVVRGGMHHVVTGVCGTPSTLMDTSGGDLEVDCIRKSLYIPWQSLHRITQYYVPTRTHTSMIGTGSSGYNGPGPLSATSWLTDSPSSVLTAANGLLFNSNAHDRLSLYGFSSTTSTSLYAGVCATQSISETPDDVNKARRFFGTGVDEYAGEGLVVRDNPSLVSASFPSGVVFNTLNDDLYTIEYSRCHVRKIPWWGGAATALMGSPASAMPCGSFDSTNPQSAMLSNPWEGTFVVFSASTVTFWITERSAPCKIRLMDMVTNAVSTWAGTVCGSGTNVNRLSAQYNWPFTTDYYQNVLYVAEYASSRVSGISRISGMSSVVVTSCSQCHSVAMYRGLLLYVPSPTNQLFVYHVGLGWSAVFIGSTVAGSSTVAGNVQFNDIRSVHADCKRKSLIISEITGAVVKEVNVRTLATTQRAGVAGSLTLNPTSTPQSASQYTLYGPMGARAYKSYLYIGLYWGHEFVVVGLDNPPGRPDFAGCVGTRTQTESVSLAAPYVHYVFEVFSLPLSASYINGTIHIMFKASTGQCTGTLYHLYSSPLNQGKAKRVWKIQVNVSGVFELCHKGMSSASILKRIGYLTVKPWVVSVNVSSRIVFGDKAFQVTGTAQCKNPVSMSLSVVPPPPTTYGVTLTCSQSWRSLAAVRSTCSFPTPLSPKGYRSYRILVRITCWGVGTYRNVTVLLRPDPVDIDVLSPNVGGAGYRDASIRSMSCVIPFCKGYPLQFLLIPRDSNGNIAFPLSRKYKVSVYVDSTLTGNTTTRRYQVPLLTNNNRGGATLIKLAPIDPHYPGNFAISVSFLDASLAGRIIATRSIEVVVVAGQPYALKFVTFDPTAIYAPFLPLPIAPHVAVSDVYGNSIGSSQQNRLIICHARPTAQGWILSHNTTTTQRVSDGTCLFDGLIASGFPRTSYGTVSIESAGLVGISFGLKESANCPSIKARNLTSVIYPRSFSSSTQIITVTGYSFPRPQANTKMITCVWGTHYNVTAIYVDPCSVLCKFTRIHHQSYSAGLLIHIGNSASGGGGGAWLQRCQDKPYAISLGGLNVVYHSSATTNHSANVDAIIRGVVGLEDIDRVVFPCGNQTTPARLKWKYNVRIYLSDSSSSLVVRMLRVVTLSSQQSQYKFNITLKNAARYAGRELRVVVNDTKGFLKPSNQPVLIQPAPSISLCNTQNTPIALSATLTGCTTSVCTSPVLTIIGEHFLPTDTVVVKGICGSSTTSSSVLIVDSQTIVVRGCVATGTRCVDVELQRQVSHVNTTKFMFPCVSMVQFPPFPVVTRLRGCPVNSPLGSIAECHPDGLNHETVVIECSTPITNVSFFHPETQTSLSCGVIAVRPDGSLNCTGLVGSGEGYIPIVTSKVGITSSPVSVGPTLSFAPVYSCNPACAGGMCDRAQGQCRCYQDLLRGYWQGSSCDTCTVGYVGTNCTIQCPGLWNGVVCNGHGSCDNNGTCACNRGYDGADCSVMCPCEHGRCVVDNICICFANPVQGYWTGVMCDVCIPEYSGSACTKPCPLDASGTVCSGYGLCNAGQCFCDSSSRRCGLACETTNGCTTTCPSGYWGSQCSRQCPNGASSPCYGRGICRDGITGDGSCMCQEGYAGVDCSMVCPGGVLNACNGHGRCDTITGECVCSTFFSGWSCEVTCPGYPNVCNNQGTCVNGACICERGYTGMNCDADCPGGVTTPCSNHGECLSNGTCLCSQDPVRGYWTGSTCDVCLSPWGGPRCSHSCPSDTSRTVCYGHGVCNTTTATCICFSHPVFGFWDISSSCQDCASGYWGNDCRNECPGGACNSCAGHGTCNDGRSGTGECTCSFGWQSPWCEDCIPTRFGPNCDKECPMDTHGDTCGGHGTCGSGVTGTGLCECLFPWTTSKIDNSCTQCFQGYYGRNCSNRITCGTGAMFIFDGVEGNGTCVCLPGWGGASCDTACPRSQRSGGVCGGSLLGYCSANGTCTCYTGAELSTVDNTCVSAVVCPCIHGSCQQAGSQSCTCDAGWYGEVCDQECIGGRNNPCNGRGTCAPRDGVCRCLNTVEDGFWAGKGCTACDVFYTSSTCAIPCPVTPRGVCNGHGRCYEGVCYLCDDGYCGVACHKTTTECRPCLSDDCSGHGWCNTEIGNTYGKCLCFPGYYGLRCTEKPCPSNGEFECSGHGSCVPDLKICTCSKGYGAEDCSVQCPTTTPGSPCSSHGKCTTAGLCECSPGYGDVACNKECPGKCSGHGTCSSNSGLCQCFSNATSGYWSGADCNECQKGYGAQTCTLKCAHGRTIKRDCVCDSYWGSPTCATACPGYLEGGVTGICTGHGTCLQQLSSCVCSRNWYTWNCSRYCTRSKCQTTYGMQNPTCSQRGECVCANSEDLGYWVGDQCDRCALFWWGPDCTLPCLCNNNGGCDAVTGTCICFSDDIRGYWSGTYCDVCAVGYVGVRCTGRDISMNEIVDSQRSFPTLVGYVNHSVWCESNDGLYLFVGGSPLLVIWKQNSTLIQTVSFPSLVVVLGFIALNDTHYSASLSNGAIAFVALKNAEITVFESNPNNLPSSSLHHRHRHYQSLSASYNFTIVYVWKECFHVISVDGWVRVMSANTGAVVNMASRVSPSDDFIVKGLLPYVSSTNVLVYGSNTSARSIFLTYYSFSDNKIEHSNTITLKYATSTLITDALGVSISIEKCTSVGDNQVVCAVLHAKGVSIFRLSSNNMSTNSLTPTAWEPITILNHYNAGDEITAICYDETLRLLLLSIRDGISLTGGDILYKLDATTLFIIGTVTLDYRGIDRERVSSIVVQSDVRIAKILLVTAYAYRIVHVNVFGVDRVEPNVLDAEGGTEITMYGDAFGTFATPYCLFGDKVLVPATYKDTRSVTCTTPNTTLFASLATSGSCSKTYVNVMFGSNTTNKTVRVSSSISSNIAVIPGVHLEGILNGDPFTSNLLQRWITVIGFGFVDSPFLGCRIGGAVTIRRKDVKYLNTTAIACFHNALFPYITPPASAFISVTLDGTIYTPFTVPYVVVGESAAIAVDAKQQTTPVTVASAVESIVSPPIRVNVVDRLGNPVSYYDTEPHRIIRVVVSTRDDVIVWYPGNATTRSVGTTEGKASFPRIAFASPPVCEFKLGFIEVSKGWTAYLSVQVVVGAPSKIVVLNAYVLASTLLWRISTQEVKDLDPNPIVGISDSGGNRVKLKSMLPVRLAATYELAYATSQNQYNHSLITQDAMLNEAVGEYVFRLITYGVFGKTYAITFHMHSNDDTNTILPYVLGPIPVENCSSMWEYGAAGTADCFHCYPHAICDGTTNVDVQDGYWRAHSLSHVMYQCRAGSKACQHGTCTEAYHGMKCSSCAAGYTGYGGSADCVACAASPAGRWISFLLSIGVSVLMLAGMITHSIRNNKRVKGENNTMLSTLLKMLLTHAQILGQVLFLNIPFPQFASDFLAVQSMSGNLGGLDLPGLDCISELNAFQRSVAVLVAPGAVIALIALCHLAKVIISRKLKKSNTHGGEVEPAPALERVRKEELEGKTDVKQKLRKAVRMIALMHNETTTAATTTPDEVILNKSHYRYLWFVNHSEVFRFYVVVFGVVYFTFYPSVLKACANMIRCEDIDIGDHPQHKYLRVSTLDTSIRCDHKAAYDVTAISTMASWTFIIPLLMTSTVVILARLTRSIEVACGVFSIITSGYRLQAWFWEVVVIVRKSLLVYVTIFLAPSTQEEQRKGCYIAMWCFTCLVVLSYFVSPYENRLLSRFEMLSSVAIVVTLNGGMLYWVPEFRSDASSFYGVAILLVLLNMIVFILLGYFVVRDVFSRVRIYAMKDPNRFIKKFPLLAELLGVEKVVTEDDLMLSEMQTNHTNAFIESLPPPPPIPSQLSFRQKSFKLIRSAFSKLDGFLKGLGFTEEEEHEEQQPTQPPVQSLLRRNNKSATQSPTKRLSPIPTVLSQRARKKRYEVSIIVPEDGTIDTPALGRQGRQLSKISLSSAASCVSEGTNDCSPNPSPHMSPRRQASPPPRVRSVLKGISKSLRLVRSVKDLGRLLSSRSDQVRKRTTNDESEVEEMASLQPSPASSITSSKGSSTTSDDDDDDVVSDKASIRVDTRGERSVASSFASFSVIKRSLTNLQIIAKKLETERQEIVNHLEQEKVGLREEQEMLDVFKEAVEIGKEELQGIIDEKKRRKSSAS
eukprot:PhF_6_TR15967/c0_g1_i1/m.24932